MFIDHFDLAKIQHDQARKLLKKKLSSQLQYDQAAAELKSARAALDHARDNLQYTRLVAPFDGIVARVDAENYQAIQAKVPIIQLQDDERLDIRFSNCPAWIIFPRLPVTVCRKS